MSKTAPPKSTWARSTRLVSLAAGLAGKEVASRLGRAFERGEQVAQRLQQVKVQVEQAKAIVESLGQLKGAAMKAGQLLSMELRDVLPPEVIEVLSQLQDAGQTVDFAEVRSILLEELGPERLAQLEVSPTPLASASIGQVHRARWTRPDGVVDDVVLKVQFRGIAETIDSDLVLLERLARVVLATQGKTLDLEGVFAELQQVLELETDYLHEAQQLERYRARAHEVPGLRVPAVAHPLCSRRVLALSYEHGLKLDAFLARQPPVDVRERVAHQVLDLYFREFFDWGLVQTDANFANFLFRPEAGELVLLDFGATRAYPPEFRERYQRLLRSSLAGDRPVAFAVAVELGLIDAQETPRAREALHELLETVLRVFRPEHQPVDFSDDAFVAAAGAKLTAFFRALTVSKPPAQLIFLHRKLGGVYSLGRALRVRLDLRRYWERLEATTVPQLDTPEAEVPAVPVLVPLPA